MECLDCRVELEESATFTEARVQDGVKLSSERQAFICLQCFQEFVVDGSSLYKINRRWENLSIHDIVGLLGIKSEKDASVLNSVVEEVVLENPNQTAAYKAGKTSMINFFVGQAMKKSKGKADPEIVKKLFQDLLK